MTVRADKPDYRVPSMAEIAGISRNGLTFVSTFSGAGGTSLGFRMAGFRTLWASEFIDIAADTYELNHPGVPVSRDDIRDVSGAYLLAAIGLAEGELDVLEGSPPCASFSMSGKRSKSWGEIVPYSETAQRVDDLFFEFTRLVREVRPRVFVAENVAGILRGVAKGYFLDILEAMRAAGYRVSARLLDAQWLGVPQRRTRLFFIGVREDLDAEPVHPLPLAFRYSVRDAVPWIDLVRGGPAGVEEEIGEDIADYAIGREWLNVRPGGSSDRYLNLVKPHPDRPAPTITQLAGQNAGTAGIVHPFEKRKLSIAELKRLCSFPDDFRLLGTFGQRWERLGRAVPPVMAWHVARAVRDGILRPLDGDGPWGGDPPELPRRG